MILFLESNSENFHENVHLKLSLLFSQQEKQKHTSRKHKMYSRKEKAMCLEVPGDNLDTWVVTMLLNVASGKSCNFHDTIANVF